jgi:hypothetical protein
MSRILKLYNKGCYFCVSFDHQNLGSQRLGICDNELSSHCYHFLHGWHSPCKYFEEDREHLSE